MIFLEPQSVVAGSVKEILRAREKNSISLELEFSKQREDPLQRIFSFIEREPNAYATGFFVAPKLVVTAYHVVSGELDVAKRLALGFGRMDELVVKVYIKGCQARILAIDKEADLALLEVRGASPQSPKTYFQSAVTKDERLLVIARPRGDKVVSYGTLSGTYSLNGVDYWSANIIGRDGFSGSPLYNEQGELVGVFSGYDWSQRLAVISPAARAEKLVASVGPIVKP